MKKTIKNGKVAVLISGSFGAGWSTWMDDDQAEILMFHPAIVEAVEANEQHLITEQMCKELLNTKDYICTLGASDLYIEWVTVGTKFRITEYDGSESLEYLQDMDYITA